MLVSLRLGALLALTEHRARVVEAVELLQEHPQLQIGGEIVGFAREQGFELRRCPGHVARALALEGERIARERVVGLRGDESAKLIDPIHGSARSKESRSSQTASSTSRARASSTMRSLAARTALERCPSTTRRTPSRGSRGRSSSQER